MPNRRRLLIALTLALTAAPAVAHEQEGTVTPKLQVELPDIGKGDKEAVMLTVDYPPGGETPMHRHDAHVFVYVIEGAVVMKVKGGDEKTVKTGETFYENPTDVHEVSRNASKTEPAKMLVTMIKAKGAAPVLPAR